TITIPTSTRTPTPSRTPALLNWQAFAQDFSSKFGIFDTVVEAEENLFNLWMRNNERFTTFIIHFEKEAYETGWNYNTLWFALHHALPQHIKDILHLTSKQPTNNSYKALFTQINQGGLHTQHLGHSGTPPGTLIGKLGVPQAMKPLALHCLPISPHNCLSDEDPPLNTANTQEVLDPDPMDNNVPQDLHNILDFADDKEALCAS
ncbi:hypothetical protein C0993_008423, partial [Termitomyces sp. T159_Od127]